MTVLLASVRSADEALDAARAGAEIIDLKEPDAGALGGVDVDEIARIVKVLRTRVAGRSISATIGDLPAHALDEITARVLAVAAAGVDYVKVGVQPGSDGLACLRHLAQLPASVVPVLLSDHGIDRELVGLAARLGFAAVVFDTAIKDGRSLFDCVDHDGLASSLDEIRAHGRLCALAGSLRWDDLALVRAFAPDIVGFRGALCAGAAGRSGRLDAARVRMFVSALCSVAV
jgi:(5-formylfuran-3-yl)methyl phosphate synthase